MNSKDIVPEIDLTNVSPAEAGELFRQRTEAVMRAGGGGPYESNHRTVAEGVAKNLWPDLYKLATA